MEINGVNEFKVRAVNNALFNLERVTGKLEDMSPEELQALKGVGKSIAEQIAEIIAENESTELRRLLEQTPKGVVELLNISGVGAKKIQLLWKDLKITSPLALKDAIESGQLEKVKGFGEKTIRQVQDSLNFYLDNKHKLLISEALVWNDQILELLSQHFKGYLVIETGSLRRHDLIISEFEYLIEDKDDVFAKLKEIGDFAYDEKRSSPFAWRGIHEPSGMHIQFRKATNEQFYAQAMITTGPRSHVQSLGLGNAIHLISSEEEIYQKAGHPFIPADIRIAPDVLKTDPERIKNLIEKSDIKGILHAHSTYSDGQQSIREMVEACHAEGFSYLGMTDHSKSSFFYANGLFENRVMEQFREIDMVQKEYPDFRIFKGIECDILSDGSLDYPNEFLQEFDFIIISVHSVLNMDLKTATARLVKAIENPFSTILGHLTGRLLLRRQGYPLHMPTILDACRDNGVSIEINANPRRLDIDWTYLPEVLDRGIKISINPDAHNIRGFSDVSFGVMAARKGLVTPEDNLTSLTADELDEFFLQRKENSIQKVSHEH